MSWMGWVHVESNDAYHRLREYQTRCPIGHPTASEGGVANLLGLTLHLGGKVTVHWHSLLEGLSVRAERLHRP